MRAGASGDRSTSGGAASVGSRTTRGSVATSNQRAGMRNLARSGVAAGAGRARATAQPLAPAPRVLERDQGRERQDIPAAAARARLENLEQAPRAPRDPALARPQVPTLERAPVH